MEGAQNHNPPQAVRTIERTVVPIRMLLYISGHSYPVGIVSPTWASASEVD